MAKKTSRIILTLEEKGKEINSYIRYENLENMDIHFMLETLQNAKRDLVSKMREQLRGNKEDLKEFNEAVAFYENQEKEQNL